MIKRSSLIKNHTIYLLPNLFTLAALFCGFYAIVQSMNRNFEHAALAIFIAMIFDGLDGRVARWTDTQSDFGAEFDSLSDMVSFGVAPALVAYEWMLRDLSQMGWGKLGWMVAFIYCACGALRLARFNTMINSDDQDRSYFTGMPSPSAAALVASAVWVCRDYGWTSHNVPMLPWVILILTLLAGLTMVSPVKFYSFKEFHFKQKVPLVALLLVLFLLLVIASSPSLVLFVFFLGYVVWAYFRYFWIRQKDEQRHAS
jgi:CDP-diacylglycerol--serine O-phosphatidyltransferase